VSNSTRSTSYDERYVVPLEASRRGAHRARVSPVVAALPVAAVAGIVVGAIALVYVVFGSLGGGSGSDTALTPASTPTAGASAGATSGAASSAPAAGDTATPTSEASAGAVDKTIPVAVFNGSGTSGLGVRGGDRLKAAGWTVGEPQTWNGTPVRTTTVFYATAAQKVSATSILKTLGHGQSKLSPSRAGAGITVVIGPDYPGAGPTKVRSTAATGANRTATPGASAAKTDTAAPPASAQGQSPSATG